jgi:cytoskeletal protein CcmA (bactofilin family)
MGVTLAVLLFFAIVLGLAALPLLPGFVELRRRADTRPLRVVRASDVDIRYFARGFRAWVDAKLGEPLAAARASGEMVGGDLPDGTRFAALPTGGVPALRRGAKGPAVCRQVVAACGDLRLPPRALYEMEIFAEGTLEGGEGNVYRALLAGHDIHLERGSSTLRWLHAGGSVLAREECRLFGRASADEVLRLETGCRFERLHAPTVAFAAPGPPAPQNGHRQALEPGEVAGLDEAAAGRWLVRGSLTVPAGRLVASDLIVTGSLRILTGARIAGSVKSHGDLVLEDRACVDGSVVTERDLRIGRSCRIGGPVAAEGDAFVGTGTRLGSAESPTTLSVRRLRIEAGAVAHGSVWAHAGGEVLPFRNGGPAPAANGSEG